MLNNDNKTKHESMSIQSIDDLGQNNGGGNSTDESQLNQQMNGNNPSQFSPYGCGGGGGIIQ